MNHQIQLHCSVADELSRIGLVEIPARNTPARRVFRCKDMIVSTEISRYASGEAYVLLKYTRQAAGRSGFIRVHTDSCFETLFVNVLRRTLRAKLRKQHK